MQRSLYANISFILISIFISITTIIPCSAQETGKAQKGEYIDFDIAQLRKIAEQDTAHMIIIPRVYDKPISIGDPLSLKLDLRGIAQPDIITFGQPALQLMEGMPIYAHRHGDELPGIGGYNAIGLALVTYLNEKTRLINGSEAVSSFYTPYNYSPFHNLGVYSAMEYEVDDHLTLSTYGHYLIQDNKNSRIIRPAFVPQNIIGGSAKFKINDNVKVRVGVEVRQYR